MTHDFSQKRWNFSNFQLNKDLKTISKEDFQWKIVFKADPIILVCLQIKVIRKFIRC